jgi:hypothetical protein
MAFNRSHCQHGALFQKIDADGTGPETRIFVIPIKITKINYAVQYLYNISPKKSARFFKKKVTADRLSSAPQRL